VRVAKDPPAVRDYWTKERMREAIPLGPISSASKAAGKRRGGTARRVRRVRRSPQRTHGKVFFTLPSGDFVCSGTSVKAPSNRLVWTAGHCVGDPGVSACSLASNWMFAPAYRNGRAPFGEWPATQVAGAPGWCTGQPASCTLLFVDCDFRFDLGAARVAKNGAGRTLARVVGARRIGFNLSRSRTYRGYGYPAAGSFNGERMFRCRSGHAGNDGSMGSPKPLRFNCNMTEGSSGGSWVVRGGRVASVVSYGLEGDNKHLFGPYHGGAAKRFYRSVK
jgi:hypothetical protein